MNPIDTLLVNLLTCLLWEMARKGWRWARLWWKASAGSAQ